MVMKTVLKVAGLIAVAAALLGLGLFAGTQVAQAQGFTDSLIAPVRALNAAGQQGGPGGQGRPHGDKGWMADYRDELHAAIADGLGMTVEEFDAAIQGGKTPFEIATDKGLTQAQFGEILLNAHKEVLALAVSDGKLTQDEADQILAHMQARIDQGLLPGGGKHGGDCNPPAGAPADAPASNNPQG
jgi:hypothetical protein